MVLRGVPAREAAAEEGLVGETDPPFERCEEDCQAPAFVGEVVVEEGMVNWLLAAAWWLSVNGRLQNEFDAKVFGSMPRRQAVFRCVICGRFRRCQGRKSRC